VTDDHLIGWLVFAACQEHGACIPDGVHDRLLAKGWVDSDCEITDAGKAVCDLHAEEWGVPSPWERSEDGDDGA
jgi:hypothetical protein